VAGYTTFIATSDRSIEQEKASLQSFIDHRVDGLIIATRGTKDGDEVLKDISRQGIPVAAIVVQ